MAFEFRLPDIGEGVAEGEVVQWFVKEGDEIREDAPLVSVLTDKANVEIPSPKSGRIEKLHAAVGEKVKVGGLLVTIETPGGGASAAAPPSPSSAPTSPALTPPRPVARSPEPSGTAPSPAYGPVSASPYVRRLAAERGIDLSHIQGSGPGGRITESDLGADSTPSLEKAPTPTPGAGAGPLLRPCRGSGFLGGRSHPRAGSDPRIRRVIAEHMAESSHRAAPFTNVEEVDVSELVLLRERMAKHVEKQGVRLSYLPFIVKAVVAGLKAHPRMNATMDDEHNELLVRAEYNIGIATAAPDGLIVPVVHQADQKSLNEIAREIQDLAERGRSGKLTRAELTGSTFTITSLGALGGVLATPILNYPRCRSSGSTRSRGGRSTKPTERSALPT